MAKVYRLENEKGEGIYTSRPNSGGFCYFREAVESCGAEWGDWYMCIKCPLPVVQDEELGFYRLVDKAAWKFGFASIEQIGMWLFNQKFFEALHNMGIKVGVYEVPDEYFRKSANQAIFHTDSAAFVKDISLLEIMNFSEETENA